MLESTEQNKQHILIIDDSKVVRWQASKLLEEDYQVHLAEDGRQGWEILQENDKISMAFCDIQMPEMNGYELLEQVRNCGNLRLINLPIVMVTGDADDHDTKHRCLDAGATDFIPKPFDELIIKGRAAAYTGYHSRLAKLEAQVERDQLTGLASVQYFRRYGEKALAMAGRHDTDTTIVLAELDNQEQLIERLGKKVFAQVLARLGKQLEQQLREEDLVARVGLARFGVLLPVTNRIGAVKAVERIHQCAKLLRLKFAGERLELSCSVGATTLSREQQRGFVELVKDAETALRQAQADGGDAVALFGAKPEAPAEAEATAAAPAEAATAPQDTQAAQPAPVATAAQQSETAVAEPAAVAVPEAAPENQPSTETQAQAVPDAALPLALPPLRELDQLTTQAAQTGLENNLLRALVRRLLPLLQHADEKLALGLGDALMQARKKLEID